MTGFMISAEILFLAMEKPKMMKITLNIYSKCLIRSIIEFYSAISLNFYWA
jgi:hypothetical protein